MPPGEYDGMICVVAAMRYCISLFLLAPRYIAVTVQCDDMLFFKYTYILAYSILVFRILEPCYRVLSGSLLPSTV